MHCAGGPGSQSNDKDRHGRQHAAGALYCTALSAHARQHSCLPGGGPHTASMCRPYYARLSVHGACLKVEQMLPAWATADM